MKLFLQKSKYLEIMGIKFINELIYADKREEFSNNFKHYYYF